MASAGSVHVHPPKVEVFDTLGRTNTDPKGVVRPVDVYEATDWGLYMARPSDHPSFDYLESWIIPSLGIRASVFHYVPRHRRDQNYYVDIGDFTRDAATWRSVDHYLDIVVRTGRDSELLDVDELLAAHTTGLLDAGTVETAIRTATAAIDGIASAGHDLDRWLASLGMPTRWR
jgi:predicted RNA-binding protein associated with RNAse of E/G family